MIKTWQQRCEEHPDHEGVVTEQMIRDRMQEEIDELRQALAQPKREWVGLTDEEIESELTKEFAQWWSRHVSVCRAIEAKLKEKNHD
jgi:hypothetical protein